MKTHRFNWDKYCGGYQPVFLYGPKSINCEIVAVSEYDITDNEGLLRVTYKDKQDGEMKSGIFVEEDIGLIDEV